MNDDDNDCSNGMKEYFVPQKPEELRIRNFFYPDSKYHQK